MLGLPNTLALPTVGIVIAVIIFVILLFSVVVFIAFAAKIPYVKDQFVAQIRKRPGIFMHSVNKQIHFYAPKRAGKHEERNTLDLPHAIGSLFTPEPKHIEHFDRLPIANYFTKCSISLPSEQVAAINRFYDFMGKRGVPVNEELIDVLIVRGNDVQDVYEEELWKEVQDHLPLPIDIPTLSEPEQEVIDTINRELADIDIQISELQAMRTDRIHEWHMVTGLIDEETGKHIQTLQQIKNELENEIVRDGLFVFQQVQDFAVAVADRNSSNISEAISIANAEALSNAEKPSRSGDLVTLMAALVFGLAGLGIVYKIMQ